jgi:hypothetical protein
MESKNKVTTKEIPKRELRGVSQPVLTWMPVASCYNKRNPKKGIESGTPRWPCVLHLTQLQQKKSQKGN